MVSTPSAGDVVAGRYRIRERIGSGGFATVWLARDTQADREVALKVADDSSHDWSEVTDRFEQELRTLRGIRQAGIPSTVVRFVDGQVTDDSAFVAMEYVSGKVLEDALNDGAVRPGSKRAHRIGVELCDAVSFLHRNGLLYLDLKPSNVIIRKSGKPVLVDFNTAVQRRHGSSTLFYSDSYKAPEQTPGEWRERAVGPWSDVYASGKLLFFLLTGQELDTEDTPTDGLNPRDYRTDCSAALSRCIERATIADPDERIQDCVSLYREVASAMNRLHPRALLTHLETDIVTAVGPDATLGRWSMEHEPPTIVVRDSEQYVSPHHLRFERERNLWRIHDTSLNGTYLNDGNGWEYILSQNGYEKREQDSRFQGNQSQPPTVRRITDGDLIAPVDPDYGIRFRFNTMD